MNKFSAVNIRTTVELWKYTRKEWNSHSLWKHVNYLNKPIKVSDLIIKS